MTSAGTLSQWLLPSSPNVVNLLMVFSIASSMVLALAFTRNFNTASLNGHILDQIIKGTGVVAALTAGVSLAARTNITLKSPRLWVLSRLSSLSRWVYLL